MTGLPFALGPNRYPVPKHPEWEIADGESVFDDPWFVILKRGTDEQVYHYMYRTREDAEFAAQHGGRLEPD